MAWAGRRRSPPRLAWPHSARWAWRRTGATRSRQHAARLRGKPTHACGRWHLCSLNDAGAGAHQNRLLKAEGRGGGIFSGLSSSLCACNLLSFVSANVLWWLYEEGVADNGGACLMRTASPSYPRARRAWLRCHLPAFITAGCLLRSGTTLLASPYVAMRCLKHAARDAHLPYLRLPPPCFARRIADGRTQRACACKRRKPRYRRCW